MARARRGAQEPPENEERWLLTYADMLTLMFALFMVLFSISSVNISKFKVLQQSLKSAFSGSVLTGGRSVIQSGSQSSVTTHNPAAQSIPALVPLTPSIPKPGDTSAKQIAQAMLSASASSREQTNFEHLRKKLEAYAKAHGFGDKVTTVVNRQGLVVRVLTDNLLFASGSATLQSQGDPLLDEVANLLKLNQTHPIVVEGNTDNVPIHTTQFASNWELSTTRATTVVRYFIAHAVPAQQLGAAGYADLHPLASNSTATGRAKNRRVDIVMQRLYPVPPATPSS
jgi:chemotaxis protein MotB